jgi:hypothetical protein
MMAVFSKKEINNEDLQNDVAARAICSVPLPLQCWYKNATF